MLCAAACCCGGWVHADARCAVRRAADDAASSLVGRFSLRKAQCHMAKCASEDVRHPYPGRIFSSVCHAIWGCLAVSIVFNPKPI
eukprot:2912890-Prymnesium_polylepis.1